MFNLHLFEGKTIRSFDRRGDQVTVYFTDESFLIISTRGAGIWRGNAMSELEFTGRALDNETH